VPAVAKHRWALPGILAVVVVVAIVAAAALRHRSSGSPVDTVDWTLVGVGPDGRSLLVSEPTDVCGDAPKPELLSQTAKAIQIQLNVKESDCNAPLNAGDPPLLTVALNAPLRGQTIGGPMYQAFEGRKRSATPSVVGLGPEDAAAVLSAATGENGHVRFVGTTTAGTWITRQLPPAGSPVATSAKGAATPTTRLVTSAPGS
jgi:hypothetical protein